MNAQQMIIDNIHRHVYDHIELAQLLSDSAGIIRANVVLFLLTEKSPLCDSLITALLESLQHEAVAEFKLMGRLHYKHLVVATLASTPFNEAHGLLLSGEDREIIDELLKHSKAGMGKI